MPQREEPPGRSQGAEWCGGLGESGHRVDVSGLAAHARAEVGGGAGRALRLLKPPLQLEALALAAGHAGVSR